MHTVDLPLEGFAHFADLLPEPMLLVDGNGGVLDGNAAAAALFGVASKQLVDRQLSSLLADGASVADLLRSSSRSKTFVPGSAIFKKADGTLLPCTCEGAVYTPRSASAPAVVLLRIANRELAANRFVALNVKIEELSREVGRRRAAESSAHVESSRLRVTLSSIGDAVIATDNSGRITLMNAIAEALTGWSFDDAKGRVLDEVFAIVNEISGAVVESPVSRVLREGCIVGLANHTVLIARDGSRRAIDDSGAPIIDDSGALIGVVLVFHDISERSAMEHELRQKSERLEENDRRKDEFLSMLAHELRNPLAPLATGAHTLLRSRESSPGVQKVATMMLRQVAHMTRLIDDLLDVARLTRGSIALRKTSVSLNQVLKQAVEMSRVLIETRDHRLSIETIPSDLCLNADFTRLVQVFGNLLNNAAKYTPPGGRISISAKKHSGVAVVTVRDNGDGIQESLLPQVFDLFTQGERSLDRSQGGLGLGLTIVRAIVELHEGRVEACNNTPESGASVSVTIPVSGSTVGETDAKEGAYRGVESARSLRVLIVDDNVDAAESLAAIVEGWGHQVQYTTNSNAAIAACSQLRPDAVLLDLGLPGLDGYELAVRLRALVQAPLLLVAVTGYGQESDRARSREAGIHKHLVKPIDMDELYVVLNGPEASGREAH